MFRKAFVWLCEDMLRYVKAKLCFVLFSYGTVERRGVLSCFAKVMRRNEKSSKGISMKCLVGFCKGLVM